jgi:hypothetical protein
MGFIFKQFIPFVSEISTYSLTSASVTQLITDKKGYMFWLVNTTSLDLSYTRTRSESFIF